MLRSRKIDAGLELTIGLLRIQQEHASLWRSVAFEQ